MRPLLNWVGAGATVAAVALGARPASACAVVGPDQGPARLAGESTLVAYDGEAQVEHFVRAVRFTAGVSRFGFLVPVPGKPTIAEAKEEIFARLEELAAPRSHGWTKSEPQTAVASASPERAVTVVERAKLKGLDYVVLQATGGKELTAWLDENKFVSYPELAPWAEHYAKEQAYFVAFKYELPQAGAAIEALPSAVRISFPTSRPFYPYREPRPQGGDGRLLRLFVLGEGPVSTVVAGAKWGVLPTFSEALTDADRASLEALLPDAKLGGASWLSAYSDPTAVRPVADLYFSFQWKHQTLALRLAVIFVVLGGLFGGVSLVMRRRRKRAEAAKA